MGLSWLLKGGCWREPTSTLTHAERLASQSNTSLIKRASKIRWASWVWQVFDPYSVSGSPVSLRPFGLRFETLLRAANHNLYLCFGPCQIWQHLSTDYTIKFLHLRPQLVATRVLLPYTEQSSTTRIHESTLCSTKGMLGLLVTGEVVATVLGPEISLSPSSI